MLTKIRKGTDNLLVRIILGLIALSFVGIGGASFIGGNSAGDIVSFGGIESISMEDFQEAKAQEIDILQRQNGINLTEENIAELGIEHSVLKRLINESMIKYLANYYEFDISEDAVINFVKKSHFFRNQHGEFDLSIFKGAFHNSKRKEDEYLESVKKHLITKTLINVFMNSFNPPKIMTENMVDYMAETRASDILSIDLAYKPNGYKPEPIDGEQLEHFYNNNQEMFVIPESRSFSYLKADKAFLAKTLKISDSELKAFFEENQDEFGSKDYKEAKKQVIEVLTKERTENLSNELAKNFEEDVSSGLTIKEIAQKYELEEHVVKDLSLAEMSSSSIAEYAELADSVFEMIEGEVSYPIEIQGQNEILIVSLNSVAQSRQKPFAEVEKDIHSIIGKRALAAANIAQLETLQKSYDPNKVNINTLKGKGIACLNNKTSTRAELPLEDKLPPELLSKIFTVQKNNSTSLVSDGKQAYFAYLKTINISNAKSRQIRKNSGEHFSNIIKEGVFQELIGYLGSVASVNRG